MYVMTVTLISLMSNYVRVNFMSPYVIFFLTYATALQSVFSYCAPSTHFSNVPCQTFCQ